MKILATIISCLIVFSWVVSRPYAEQPEVIASYYGERYRGRPTASHYKNWQYSYFNPDQLTAAHKTLPFGTKIKVSYKGKSVICVITDRGPFIKGRTLDLSRRAFSELAHTDAGILKVKVEVIK
jgi:rare lipoprotein A